MVNDPFPSASSRAHRLAARDGMISSSAVARTNRLDGRSRVVAVRDVDGWRAVRGLRWTRAAAGNLRAVAVHEVIVRRGLRYGRFPLSWVPTRLVPATAAPVTVPAQVLAAMASSGR